VCGVINGVDDMNTTRIAKRIIDDLPLTLTPLIPEGTSVNVKAFRSWVISVLRNINSDGR
jgi:hypothetical protein